MKVFHCDHCGQLVFFENVECVKCNHVLAYVPGPRDLVSLDPLHGGAFTTPALPGRAFKLCANYTRRDVCNWALHADDPNPLCRACRLTRTIPDLDRPGNRRSWYRLEVAKRRLLYTLEQLKLPTPSKAENPQQGLVFDFLEQTATQHVLTGHDEGVITVNIAEADDAERERRRQQMHEPYRTLLGHFRHEIGHYFWDRLIEGSSHLDAFRQLFGDERADYNQSLQQHYREGAPAGWQRQYVSAYATMHPWEDWAETWAHYLHVTDTLETAAACGVSIRPHRRDEPAMYHAPDPLAEQRIPFDAMLAGWLPLTYMLNNLNRGLGIGDAYPFVLSKPAVEKMRFVHEVITATPPPVANVVTQ